MNQLNERSDELRHMIVGMLEYGGRGHLASALSLVEILSVLYDDVLAFRVDEPNWSDRDRMILSKGHGCMALYAVLGDKGFFHRSEFERFCKSEGILGGHPERPKVPGVEASTGALGHGLSIGVGMALSARQEGAKHRVFVIVGDGECNEGSIWEGAMCAAKHRLDSLTVIVDYNKMQSYASTHEVLELEPFADKWTAFGFGVREVDGHDVTALREAFEDLPCEVEKPTVVICHTTKGKGISGVEEDLSWHHKSRVKPEEIAALYEGIGSR
ncbi:MAG: transketolase [Gemmatimonadetes bacterium]|nr:transketolase [Gemmatimonadota bacterium]|tara:strand:+ start:12183 stop:12995 length:813 start_codon:yes stop_codon:yes gene_type:complete